MPSNLNEFGVIPSNTVKSTKSIETIPSYLRKYKESLNVEISNWENNQSTANVDQVIFAMGSGTVNFDDVSNKISYFSAFVLGKTGYINRWQSMYLLNDDYLLGYFDGESYFKRLTIRPDNGLVKLRNLESRNGNIPRSNGYFQLAFGYSPELIEDVSEYRHNIRTSHSGNSNYNGDNAFDLYLWDAFNDTPGELGSKHVVRWNAQGNEELINGFSIAGGVNVPVTTGADKQSEKDNFAISGKGVMYYNKTSNTYRYSENGGFFKTLGSGSGDGSGCLIQACTTSLDENSFTGRSDSYCNGETDKIFTYSFSESTLTSNIDVAFDRGIPSELSSIVLPEPSESLLGTNLFIYHRVNIEYAISIFFDDAFSDDSDSITINYLANNNVPVGSKILVIRANAPEKSGIHILDSKSGLDNYELNMTFNQSLTDELYVGKILLSAQSPGDSVGSEIPIYVAISAIDPLNYTTQATISSKFRFATINSLSTVVVEVDTVLDTPDALFGLRSIGGVDLDGFSSVLVNMPSNRELNGIYTASSGAWVRDSNFDSDLDFYKNASITVNNVDSIYNGKHYRLDVINDFELDVSPIYYYEYDGVYGYKKDFIKSNHDLDVCLEYADARFLQLHLKCVKTSFEKNTPDPVTVGLYVPATDPSKQYAWLVFNETITQF